ncbi:hypothetical protein GIB67_015929 [Kingdonia uniflora]|uniref:Uncharacterized protein n=1 Tax=Kingdonia uniflora TaxID=39325 RepID=A0A7J7PDM4_9MAGN|nr:hypothetical protein GIB67_015929 [Kingdonia uniflora]
MISSSHDKKEGNKGELKARSYHPLAPYSNLGGNNMRSAVTILQLHNPLSTTCDKHMAYLIPSTFTSLSIWLEVEEFKRREGERKSYYVVARNSLTLTLSIGYLPYGTANSKTRPKETQYKRVRYIIKLYTVKKSHTSLKGSSNSYEKYRVTALDLVDSGIDTKNMEVVGTMENYSKPLIEFLEYIIPKDENVILVGHSFEGLTLTLVMEKFINTISTAVFVAAFMPDSFHLPSYVLE